MASSGRKEKDPYGPLTSETRIKILSKNQAQIKSWVLI